ncbi:MAG: 5-oxoprolinase subunit PxpB [Jejuia sp.]
MKYELTYKRYGASSILIEWPQNIDTSILDDILVFKSRIEEAYSKELRFVNNAYASLLLSFKEDILDFSSEIEKLKIMYQSSKESQISEKKLWKIPVCYDESFGIDLEFLSKDKIISISEIIDLHSQPIYTVYFIGFLPGFLYLGGLNELLFTPRKASPRLNVPKGAVALGGSQTGVYPSESPGGWQIIGNSPINFFNIKDEDPCFAKAGDALKFYPVSLKVYNDIKTLADAGVYQMESEVIGD